MVKILQKQGIKKNFFILVGNKNCWHHTKWLKG
jgi:hypothetical protein